jgi:adenosylcobinamide-GDP ribazoletransferase
VSLLAALQFLTSLPTPRRNISPEALGRATAFFPAVGLIIGLVLAGLNWVLGLALPQTVVNALLIAVLTVITGALHLDGLSDTCDGLAGHRTVEERWRVMHDSHTGVFGVVGVVLVLLVDYAALSSIPPASLTPTLVFTPVVSRWAMVYAIFAYPYARPSGLGTAFKQATRWPQFTAATAITLAIAVVLFPLFSIMGIALMAGVLVVTAILAAYLKRKFAGLTGDTYGAINEVAMVTALVLTSLAYTTAVNLR